METSWSLRDERAVTIVGTIILDLDIANVCRNIAIPNSRKLFGND